MCVRAVKALARLRVCADASGALEDQIFNKCQSLMSHTMQLFSFENSGCSLILNYAYA